MVHSDNRKGRIRLISAYITLTVICAYLCPLVTVHTSAADIILHKIYKYNTNIEFTVYSDGTLVLSGKGDLYSPERCDPPPTEEPEPEPEPYIDLSYHIMAEDVPVDVPEEETGTWDDYEEQITRIFVGEGITSIGYRIFWHMPKLEYIDTPSTLKEILCYAFDGDTSLREAVIRSKNVHLDWNVFDDSSEALTVKGRSGSFTEIYTLERGIKFESLDTQKPEVSVGNCAFSNQFSVTLKSDTEGAAIYYTTDGSTPDKSSGIYSAPIEITDTTVLKAFASADGLYDSEIVSCVYTYTPPEERTPEIKTLAASDVTKSSTRLNGAVEETGISSAEKMSFVYWDKYYPEIKYTIEADETFSADISNLAPNREYCYYALASNAAGDGEGEVVTLKTLPENKPHSISVTPSAISLKTGESCQLLVDVLPVEADNRNVVWSSSDESIAEVDSTGKVTAKKTGSVTITATTEVKRLKAYCDITVILNEKDILTDFSEWNLATNTSYFAKDGFDLNTLRNGGRLEMAIAYLVRRDGAVSEEHDPYMPYSVDSEYEIANYNEIDEDYHIKDVIWIEGRDRWDNNGRIKKALIKYGGVYSSYLNDFSCYDKSRANYYYAKQNSSGDAKWHAVTIVGWDDNYSASNFKHTPPGDGAFICKNSWGESNGEKGYFYVSYHDEKFAYDKSAVFVASDEDEDYNTVYQYDPLGAVTPYAYGIRTVYGANVFPEKGKSLENDEILKAVSFYTNNSVVDYEVYIVTDYKNAASLKGTKKIAASGTLEEMGYHTISLNEPVELNAGSRFAVIVKIVAETGDGYMYCEAPIETKFTSKATAGADESYMSSNAKDWRDTTEVRDNMNVCIKAFTDSRKTKDTGVLYSGTFLSTLSEEEADETIKQIYVTDDETPGMGVIPAMIDIGSSGEPLSTRLIFPERYDLRDENCVTPVKNQGGWGTCWAHATYASLESCILKQLRKSNDAISAGGKRLELDTKIADMAVGSEMYIGVHSNSDKAVRWSSDNEAVAVVDTSGCVTAMGVGTAVVTAHTYDGAYTDQCIISVDAASEVSSVEMTNDARNAEKGDVFLLDYEVFPSNALNKNVKWSSSSPGVASVNENGLVTALSPGKTTITVTTEEGNVTDTVELTVSGGFSCEIKSVTNGLAEKDEITVSVENPMGGSIDAKVIAAIYEGDSLKSIKSIPARLLSGLNDIKVQSTGAENIDKDASSIKVFLWADESSMLPIAAVYCDKED